jgi:hypothetical protein
MYDLSVLMYNLSVLMYDLSILMYNLSVLMYDLRAPSSTLSPVRCRPMYTPAIVRVYYLGHTQGEHAGPCHSFPCGTRVGYGKHGDGGPLSNSSIVTVPAGIQNSSKSEYLGLPQVLHKPLTYLPMLSIALKGAWVC